MPTATPSRSIALAGPACGGKSTVAASLAERLDACLATARTAIARAANEAGPLDLAQLVEHGARLESECPGEWLANGISEFAQGSPVVVDAVRTRAQLAALKRWRQPLLTVFLTAPVDVRRERFRARACAGEMSFDALAATQVEREAQELAPLCDLALDSSLLSPSEIVALIQEALVR
jgi:cytidylate kinase